MVLPKTLPLVLFGSLVLLSLPASAQSFDFDIDASALPFTFGGTTNVGPIVGTPNTFDLDGTLELALTFSGPQVAGAQFVGGAAVTSPASLSGEVPSGIPGLPLASLTVNNLVLSAGSPFFAVGGGGAISTTLTFTVTAGTVDFVPLIGDPGSANIAGLMSEPTLITGTLTRTGGAVRVVFPLVTTIPFNEPQLGVSGTIDLAGTIDASFALIETFCFGDGSGAACPCGNESPLGGQAGCLNSFGTGGMLTTTGVGSVSADTLLLQGTGMPTTAPVLYFQGTAPAAGGAGVPFGDGLLCASGAVIRLGAKLNIGGASSFPIAGDSLSVRGQVPAGGATRWYQGWYRNEAGFCTPSRFNVTNGVRLTWTP